MACALDLYRISSEETDPTAIECQFQRFQFSLTVSRSSLPLEMSKQQNQWPQPQQRQMLAYVVLQFVPLQTFVHFLHLTAQL